MRPNLAEPVDASRGLFSLSLDSLGNRPPRYLCMPLTWVSWQQILHTLSFCLATEVLANWESPLPSFLLAWKQPGGGDVVRVDHLTQTSQCNWGGSAPSCLLPAKLQGYFSFWLADFWTLGLGKQAKFTLLYREETDLLLLLLRVKHLKCYSCVPVPHAILSDNTQAMVAMPWGTVVVTLVPRLCTETSILPGTDTKLAASCMEEAWLYQRGWFNFKDFAKKLWIGMHLLHWGI